MYKFLKGGEQGVNRGFVDNLIYLSSRRFKSSSHLVLYFCLPHVCDEARLYRFPIGGLSSWSPGWDGEDGHLIYPPPSSRVRRRDKDAVTRLRLGLGISPRVNVYACFLPRWVMLVSDNVQETDAGARAFIIPYALTETPLWNLVVIVWGLMMLDALWFMAETFWRRLHNTERFCLKSAIKNLMLPEFHSSTVDTLKVKRGQFCCVCI